MSSNITPSTTNDSQYFLSSLNTLAYFPKQLTLSFSPLNKRLYGIEQSISFQRITLHYDYITLFVESQHNIETIKHLRKPIKELLASSQLKFSFSYQHTLQLIQQVPCICSPL